MSNLGKEISDNISRVELAKLRYKLETALSAAIKAKAAVDEWAETELPYSSWRQAAADTEDKIGDRIKSLRDAMDKVIELESKTITS